MILKFLSLKRVKDISAILSNKSVFSEMLSIYQN